MELRDTSLNICFCGLTQHSDSVLLDYFGGCCGSCDVRKVLFC